MVPSIQDLFSEKGFCALQNTLSFVSKFSYPFFWFFSSDLHIFNRFCVIPSRSYQAASSTIFYFVVVFIFAGCRTLLLLSYQKLFLSSYHLFFIFFLSIFLEYAQSTSAKSCWYLSLCCSTVLMSISIMVLLNSLLSLLSSHESDSFYCEGNYEEDLVWVVAEKVYD